MIEESTAAASAVAEKSAAATAAEQSTTTAAQTAAAVVAGAHAAGDQHQAARHGQGCQTCPEHRIFLCFDERDDPFRASFSLSPPSAARRSIMRQEATLGKPRQRKKASLSPSLVEPAKVVTFVRSGCELTKKRKKDSSSETTTTPFSGEPKATAQCAAKRTVA
jgi:hypothetical protein